MKCICNDGCLLASDPYNYLIEVAGKRLHFEMHRWCGPAVLNSAGDPADKQPGPWHEFWTAVTFWNQQGRRVNAEGLCVWDKPEEPELVQLGGRNYAVVGSVLAERFGK